jgi:hypothetical protein
VTTFAPFTMDWSFSTTVVFPTPGIPTITTRNFPRSASSYEPGEGRRDFFHLLL